MPRDERRILLGATSAQRFGYQDSPSSLAGARAPTYEWQLPEGWTYRTRTLRKPLRVVTTTTKAAVLQDDLGNSYSRQTG